MNEIYSKLRHLLMAQEYQLRKLKTEEESLMAAIKSVATTLNFSALTGLGAQFEVTRGKIERTENFLFELRQIIALLPEKVSA